MERHLQIALTLLALVATTTLILSNVPLATADDEGTTLDASVVCETWSVDWVRGRKAGRSLIDAHGKDLKRRIEAQRAQGYVQSVYANTYPMREGLSDDIVGEIRIICFGKK